MKAYMVHDGEPSENSALVFASSVREARRIGYLHNDIGSDGWITVRADRRHDLDGFVDAHREAGYVEEHSAVLRSAGWHLDGDRHCVCCGLATMDGEFPVCMGCDRCAECGHVDSCTYTTPAAQESGQ